VTLGETHGALKDCAGYCDRDGGRCQSCAEDAHRL